MYDNGARGYMDGISIHPYPNAMDWYYTFKALSVTTEVRDVNGDAVPLWLTEIGMSTTNGWTPAQQSEVVSNVIKPLLSYPGIAGVYVNELTDPTTGPYVNQGFGMLYSNLSPKPAFCAIASVLGSGYMCPLTVLQPTPGATQLGRWQAENLLQYAANAALSYHVAHGSYSGLTSAGLHAIDARISTTPASGVNAGSGADPSQVGVYPLGGDSILLCNASTADRSYCIQTAYPGSWIYGMATGSIYSAAYAVIHRISNTW
jgi:hypothetical protein